MVDDKGLCMGCRLADGFARLGDVMAEEVVEIGALDGLYNCVAVPEVEGAVELLQRLVAVGSCKTTLIALWVE